MDTLPPSGVGADMPSDLPPVPRPADVQPDDDGFVMPPILWGPADLAATAGPPAPWLWQGMLRPGAITFLTSQWKAGKTTLVSVLLERLGSGGSLAGLPVTAGKAIVVTEEDAALWQMPSQALGIGKHVGWCCRPFRGRPKLKDWVGFINRLVQLHEREPFALLVIDPLAAFLPGSENSAGAMMDALLPLQRLTARGVSVLVLHHPSKGDPPIGQAARGNGALSGCADILLEMRYFHRAGDDDRRRRLWNLSRWPESPTRLIIEWTEDGTDYRSLGTFEEEQFSRLWHRLRAVCADAPRKLTRVEIHERWKSNRKPPRTTLKYWLEQAVTEGLLRQDGKGLRNHPFRYWLPEKEDQWRQDEWACHLMPELREKKEEVGKKTDEGKGEQGRK